MTLDSAFMYLLRSSHLPFIGVCVLWGYGTINFVSREHACALRFFLPLHSG